MIEVLRMKVRKRHSFPSFQVLHPHDVRSDLSLSLFPPQERLTFVVASEAFFGLFTEPLLQEDQVQRLCVKITVELHRTW